MKRILKIAEISALLLLVAVAILALYGLGHFELNFPPLTSENSPAREIAKSVGATNQGVMKGTVPWRRVDTSSIGFPEKEARLLTLKSDVDVFILTFGHRPSHIGEISVVLPAKTGRALVVDAQRSKKNKEGHSLE